MQQKPIDRYPKLRARYAVLEKQRRTHSDLVQKLLTVGDGNICETDLVVVAVIKRSLDLLDGIICLTDRWNFAAAAPLLRLQVDSLLRLVYLTQLEDADDVSKAILAGKSFRKLKVSDGKPLTDARLRDYARGFYPWLDRVYKEMSKLIARCQRIVYQLDANASLTQEICASDNASLTSVALNIVNESQQLGTYESPLVSRAAWRQQ